MQIKLLHTSATDCHPQGMYPNKEPPVQDANPGINCPHCHYQNFKISEYINLKNV